MVGKHHPNPNVAKAPPFQDRASRLNIRAVLLVAKCAAHSRRLRL